MFEKDMRIAELIDIYGDLLSSHQREIIEAYYFDDLSLSEISLNLGITRQGVRDSIKKSETQLRAFDEKLNLLSKNKEMKVSLNSLCDQICKISTSLPCPQSSELLEIVDRIKELI